jgi:hypothetical protein
VFLIAGIVIASGILHGIKADLKYEQQITVRMTTCLQEGNPPAECKLAVYPAPVP